MDRRGDAPYREPGDGAPMRTVPSGGWLLASSAMGGVFLVALLAAATCIVTDHGGAAQACFLAAIGAVEAGGWCMHRGLTELHNSDGGRHG